MEEMSTREKGDIFEKEVLEFFQSYVASGEYFVQPNKCKYFTQKGYYSQKRKSDIIFDVAVELYGKDRSRPAFRIILECKNLTHPVNVDDIEEFDSKLSQVAGKDIKGIMFSRVGFRKGCINFAESSGIALVRLLPEGQVDWILERTPKPMDMANRVRSEKAEVVKALIDKAYRGQSEFIFGICGNVYSSSFGRILDELIPNNLKGNQSQIRNTTSQKSVTRLAPYLGQEDIESRAERVLSFFGNTMFKERSIDLSPMCEYLNQHNGVEFIYNEDLGKNSSGKEILGKISINPTYIYISKTLEIDSSRWRFTLAHELGHFLLHRNLLIEKFKSYHEESENSLSWDSLKTSSFPRLEWQANSLASSLLIPRSRFIQDVVKEVKERDIVGRNHGLIYLDEQQVNISNYLSILYSLSSKYNVSRQAINYRLIQLRLLNNQQKSKRVKDVISQMPLIKRPMTSSSKMTPGGSF